MHLIKLHDTSECDSYRWDLCTPVAFVLAKSQYSTSSLWFFKVCCSGSLIQHLMIERSASVLDLLRCEFKANSASSKSRRERKGCHGFSGAGVSRVGGGSAVPECWWFRSSRMYWSGRRLFGWNVILISCSFGWSFGSPGFDSEGGISGGSPGVFRSVLFHNILIYYRTINFLGLPHWGRQGLWPSQIFYCC